MLTQEIRDCWTEYLKLTTQLQTELRLTQKRPFVTSGFSLNGIMLRLSTAVLKNLREQLETYTHQQSGATLAEKLSKMSCRIILVWPLCRQINTETKEETLLPLFEIDITQSIFKCFDQTETSISLVTCERSQYSANFLKLFQLSNEPIRKTRTFVVQQLQLLFEEAFSSTTKCFSSAQRFECLEEIQRRLQFQNQNLQLEDQYCITVRTPRDITCERTAPFVATATQARIRRKQEISALGTEVFENSPEEATSKEQLFGYARVDEPTVDQRLVLRSLSTSNCLVVEKGYGVSITDTLVDLLILEFGRKTETLITADASASLTAVVGPRKTLSDLEQQWSQILAQNNTNFPQLLSANTEIAKKQITDALTWLQALSKPTTTETQEIKNAILQLHEQLRPQAQDYSQSAQQTAKYVIALERSIKQYEHYLQEISDPIRELEQELNSFGTPTQFKFMFLLIRNQLLRLHQQKSKIYAKLFPFTTRAKQKKLLQLFRTEAKRRGIPALPLEIYSSIDALEEFWELLAQHSRSQQQLVSLLHERQVMQRKLNHTLEKYHMCHEKLSRSRKHQDKLLKEDSFIDFEKLEAHRAYSQLAFQFLKTEIADNKGEIQNSLQLLSQMLQTTETTLKNSDTLWAEYSIHAKKILSALSLMFPVILQDEEKKLSPLMHYAEKPILSQMLITHAEHLSCLHGYQLLSATKRAVCFGNFKNIYGKEHRVESLQRVQKLCSSTLKYLNDFYPEFVSFAEICERYQKKHFKTDRVYLKGSKTHHQEILSFSNCFSRYTSHALRPKTRIPLNTSRILYLPFPEHALQEKLLEVKAFLQSTKSEFKNARFVIENTSRKLALQNLLNVDIWTLRDCENLVDTYSKAVILLLEPAETVLLENGFNAEAAEYSLMLSRATDYLLILNVQSNNEKTVWETLFETEVAYRATEIYNLQEHFVEATQIIKD